jgi:hypothetical protein
MEGSEVQSELTIVEDLNRQIQAGKRDGILDPNLVSDGYHTIGELYDHRIELFIALCRTLHHTQNIWRSEKHHDGSSFEGWFIMGIDHRAGKQITYHLPISRWDDCSFAQTLAVSPEWDLHSVKDVLERLKSL